MRDTIKKIKHTISQKIAAAVGMTDPEMRQRQIQKEREEIALIQQKLKHRDRKLRNEQARLAAGQEIQAKPNDKNEGQDIPRPLLTTPGNKASRARRSSRRASARITDSPTPNRHFVPTQLSTRISDTPHTVQSKPVQSVPRSVIQADFLKGGLYEDATDDQVRRPRKYRNRPPPISYNTRRMGHKIQVASRRSSRAYRSSKPSASAKDKAQAAMGQRRQNALVDRSIGTRRNISQNHHSMTGYPAT